MIKRSRYTFIPAARVVERQYTLPVVIALSVSAFLFTVTIAIWVQIAIDFIEFVS